MKNWYDMLRHAMERDGEDFSKKVCTLSDDELRVNFNADDYGREEGKPFTAWGEEWVYFPITYGGSESIGQAPRNPCDISMEHQGGG